MYFKVKKNTPMFKALTELFKKVDECTDAARAFVKKVGGERFCQDMWDVAGGISAVEFKEKPAGWAQAFADKKDKNLYIPSKVNKKLYAEVKALPTVTHNEVNKVVGFKDQNVPNPGGRAGSMKWLRSPGIYRPKGMFLVEISKGAKFKPSKDLKEILYSEFERLTKKKK